MALPTQVSNIVTDLSADGVKLGDIRKKGKEIKKDHELALELWSTGNHNSRLLALLIFDKKQLTPDLIDQLAADIEKQDKSQRNQLTDWLLANQLMKDKKTVALMQTWKDHPSPILSRLFWYHQARQRWTGTNLPENSADLLDSLESDMGDAHPDVQWAMNFCAGWIGVHEPEFRQRCIELGEKFELYKGDHVSRNCTPDYLPEFIEMEVAKRV